MHTRTNLITTLALTLALAGCPGEDGDGDAFNARERASFETGGSAVVDVTALTDALEATLELESVDVSAGAAALLTDVEAQTTLATDACAEVTRGDGTLTVDFGAAPGCAIGDGHFASGSWTLAVEATDGSATFAFAFDELVLDDRSIDGSYVFTVSGAAEAMVDADLTTARGAVSADAVVSFTRDSVALDGTVSVSQPGEELTVTFADVSWTVGDCYPSSGSLTVTKGGITMTVRMDAETAATGAVDVQIGARTVPSELPAYGTCPSA